MLEGRRLLAVGWLLKEGGPREHRHRRWCGVCRVYPLLRHVGSAVHSEIEVGEIGGSEWLLGEEGVVHKRVRQRELCFAFPVAEGHPLKKLLALFRQ